MHVRMRSFLIAVAVVIVACGVESRSLRADQSDVQNDVKGRLILEDVLETLDPSNDDDSRCKRRALALFAAGRAHQRRDQYQKALKLYQRAFRYDPESVTVLRAILPLAVGLGHDGEAVRYALLLAIMDEVEPETTEDLGDHLAREVDLAGAVNLYEKALVQRERNSEPSDVLRLRWKIGRFYCLMGDFKGAVKQFIYVRKFLDHPEKFPIKGRIKEMLLSDRGSAYEIIAEALMLADRPEEAADAFKKADAATSKGGRLGFNLARVNKRVGDHEKALSNLQRYFDSHLAEMDVSPYVLLAEVLKLLGRERELVPRIEKLCEGNPDNVAVGYFLADKLRESGRLEEAEKLAVSSVKKKPTVLGYRILTDVYVETKQPEKLLKVLKYVIGSETSFEPLGPTCKKKLIGDENLVNALIRVARSEVKTGPNQFGFNQRLAVAILALDVKLYDDAARFFDLAIDANPKRAGQLLRFWGNRLVADDRFEEAAKVFRKGIKREDLGKSRSEFYYNLALALEMVGQTDEALDATRKATELQKGSPLFESRVPWIRYHAKQYSEAAELYKKLIRTYDKNFDNELTREVMRDARRVLSGICVEQDRSNEAEEWLLQILDEFPDDVSVMNDLGYVWTQEGKNLKLALKMIRTAVEAEPGNVAYRDSLGWVLFKLGKHEEAITELELAAKGEPDPVIFEHLGDVYAKLKRFGAAKKAWKKSAEMFSKEENIKGAERAMKKEATAGYKGE